jgi:peptidyl-prolyl cis-trans isomerase A (cyclophilin A)
VRRLLRPALLLLGTFVLPSASLAADPAPAPEAPPTVAVPEGLPPALDGRVVPAEWSSAAALPLGSGGARLLVQQHRGTLLLAFDLARPWPRDGRLLLFFAPDREGGGATAHGAVRLDYEPTEHNRPHLIVTRTEPGGETRHEEDAVARARVRDARATGEVAIRTALLGVAGAEKATVRFAALWVREAGEPAVVWPEGVDLAGGRVPKDYADGSRWGRLTGLADGPGAHSPSDWKRWTEEDAEMTRRGETAHGVAFLIDEEPDLRKKDREMVPDLVENLRWIAEREPLAPRDLFALATGYRFLNRRAEALAVLDALALDAAWGRSDAVAHLRARVLSSLERWDEAAATWAEAKGRASASGQMRYDVLMKRAASRRAPWEAEQRARAEDLARPELPLVLLRTSRGNVVLQLFAADVPKAARHFLDLVAWRGEGDRRVYDGTLFHRVLGDQLVQGGDPLTRGGACEEGGRGDGPQMVAAERNPRHGFWRGAVGFARGLTSENGSQFFVLTAARPDLDEQGYTCFAWVVSGMEVVDRLEQCDVLEEVRVISPGH